MSQIDMTNANLHEGISTSRPYHLAFFVIFFHFVPLCLCNFATLTGLYGIDRANTQFHSFFSGKAGKPITNLQIVI
jgi:hypothetical protein